MANFNFNKVIMGGRLTAEPELKTTQSGVSVCAFGVAVNRKAKSGETPATDFFNVTAWRATADLVARYFRKGSSICVVGSIQNSTWTDQTGQKRYKTDIVADEVMFVDSRGESSVPESSYGNPQFTPKSEPKFEAVDVDGDLPF